MRTKDPTRCCYRQHSRLGMAYPKFSATQSLLSHAAEKPVSGPALGQGGYDYGSVGSTFSSGPYQPMAGMAAPYHNIYPHSAGSVASWTPHDHHQWNSGEKECGPAPDRGARPPECSAGSGATSRPAAGSGDQSHWDEGGKESGPAPESYMNSANRHPYRDWDKGAKESGPAPDGNRAPHRSGGAGPAVEVVYVDGVPICIPTASPQPRPPEPIPRPPLPTVEPMPGPISPPADPPLHPLDPGPGPAPLPVDQDPGHRHSFEEQQRRHAQIPLPPADPPRPHPNHFNQFHHFQNHPPPPVHQPHPTRYVQQQQPIVQLVSVLPPDDSHTYTKYECNGEFYRNQFIISAIFLVCGVLCLNVFCIPCAVAACINAIKTVEANKNDRPDEAKRFHRRAKCCNIAVVILCVIGVVLLNASLAAVLEVLRQNNISTSNTQ